MAQPYFRQTDDGLLPHPRAHGPWAEDMLHGRLLGGIAARALENEIGGPGWRAARLTVDLYRPSAMAPVRIEVRPVRNGRRLRLADAVATCEGHEVGRVTGLFLPEGEEPPGRIWRPDHEPWPDPETLPPPPDPEASGGAGGDGGADDDWWFRIVEGGFGTVRRSRIWTNDTAPLVDGEAMSPLVRAAVSGDIACPLANSGDEGIHYINADYTMLLARYPDGRWIGLEVAQQLAADGIAIASATLVDRHGPFATSSGASLARPPLPPD